MLLVLCGTKNGPSMASLEEPFKHLYFSVFYFIKKNIYIYIYIFYTHIYTFYSI